MQPFTLRLSLLVALVVILPTCTLAQSGTAGLTGTVTDRYALAQFSEDSRRIMPRLEQVIVRFYPASRSKAQRILAGRH